MTPRQARTLRGSAASSKVNNMGSNDISELLKLDRNERLAIAERLWASVVAESEASPTTKSEIDFINRRLDAYLADPTGVVSWSVVKKDLGL
jgi:putative addiction module component (TIGR02574 family)